MRIKLDSWMLVFGGTLKGDTAACNSSILFNWMTLEMCEMPILPYAVSGVIATIGFGVPIFCGGFDYAANSDRKTCYKFNPLTKGWTQVFILSCIVTRVFIVRLLCVCCIRLLWFEPTNVNATVCRKHTLKN